MITPTNTPSFFSEGLFESLLIGLAFSHKRERRPLGRLGVAIGPYSTAFLSAMRLFSLATTLAALVPPGTASP